MAHATSPTQPQVERTSNHHDAARTTTPAPARMATGKATTAIKARWAAASDSTLSRQRLLARTTTTIAGSQHRTERQRQRQRQRQRRWTTTTTTMDNDNGQRTDNGLGRNDGGGQSHGDAAAGFVLVYPSCLALRVMTRVAGWPRCHPYPYPSHPVAATRAGHPNPCHCLIPPAPPSFTREQDTHTRDKPRHRSPRSHLRAREGRHRNEVRHGTGHTARDGAGEGTRNAPSPFLPGTARAMPEAARWPLSPGFRAEATRKRGARGGTRTGAPPTPFAPRRHLHAGGARSNLEQRPLSPGWRAGAAPEPERAERPPSRGRAQPQRGAPPLPRFAPGKNAHGRRRGTPLSRGFARKGERERPCRSNPPFPGFAPGRNGQTRMGGSAEPPCLSRRFARTGERERAAAQKRPPLPPGSRARAKRHAEVPPSPVCTPGARGPLLARYPHLST
ncbi:hypothetical protein EDB89DRAFT_2242996 [Lactarius sanguifluus]|nr:hypothetical protein EDB89DRAFT_2242996 [Lactarius sanguifluus]